MTDKDPSGFEKVLENYYAALRSGDRDAICDVVSKNVYVSYPAPMGLLPWGGEWNGRDAFFKFLDQVAAHLEILEVTPLRTEEFTGGVFVVLKGEWRVKSTGLKVSAIVANIFDISGGKITRYQVFNDTAAFGAALGKFN